MTPLHDARAASGAACAMVILGLLGLTIDAAYWQVSRGHAPTAHLVAVGILALLLIVLLARRNRPSEVLSAVVMLGATAAILAALWAADELLARQPRPWVPFQARKLGVLAVGMLAPTPGWVGVVCIVAFTLSMSLQYLAFPADVSARIAIDEPWASCAFGLFALGVLVHRRRALRGEHEAARAHAEAVRAQAEAASLRRLSRVSLAVRDLSNGSLQTLRLSAALLRREHPEAMARLDPIDRALDRLDELDHALAKYEAAIEWHPGDESFDPITVIESALADGAPDLPLPAERSSHRAPAVPPAARSTLLRARPPQGGREGR